MLIVLLSQKVLLFAILILIVYRIDYGNCNQNDNNSIHTCHYPTNFRAPQSPSYEYLYIPGDILLGGFFPIHQPPSNELGSMQCTAIKRERGIQRLEAMLFALDIVNTRSSHLMSSILSHSKIRFGALIYDSCDYEPYAVERALNMLLPSMDQCLSLQKRKDPPIIAGVIGSASSIVSMAISDILRLAEIPQISYASTSTELSEKLRFQFFSRVVPPDTYQAEAVVSIIQFLNWTYVAVIKETGSYGERLTDDFKAKLKNKTICIAGELSVNIKDSNSYLRVIKELYEDEKYRFVIGVVIFAQEDCVRQILNQTSSRHELLGRWVFLGTDGWGKKWYPVENFGRAAINAITLAPKLYPISAFDEYFKNLTPSKNTRNPWFVEYWEETYKCKFDHTPTTIFNHNYTRSCSDTDSTYINFSVPYFQEGYVHYVVDAVFSLVIAIQKLVDEKCLNSSTIKSLCNEFYPFDGIRLLSILRNLSFRNDLSRRNIKFTPNGDGIETYDIFQYQIINSTKTLDYFTIGEYSDSDLTNERIRIDLQKLKWSKYNYQYSTWSETQITPRSFCSESCRPGEIRTNTDSQQCCWTCRACDIFHIAVNETYCIPCSEQELPNLNFTKCIPIEEEYLSIKNIIALPALILSSIGLLMTIYTIIIFIRFSQTPIIKASSRELSYFLLSGICSCHLCAWPLVFKPYVITCLFIRIGVSLSLTICLAALLTKTNRLARIFNNKQRLTPQSCLSPRSQLGICTGIVSVQLITVLLWLFFSPPSIKLKSEIKHNQRRLILVCQTDHEYIAYSLIYNMLLVISCTLYAIKTRHIPENYNEAKYIGFAMYSICIIWLAFIPIFFGLRSSDNWFRIQFVTLAICLSLSATIILICLFAPKLHIVLFNPSKNIPSKFKASITARRISFRQSNTNNHLGSFITRSINNNQRQSTPIDCTTEVTFCTSKLDNCSLNIHDEITQTDNIYSKNLIINDTYKNNERRQQRLLSSSKDIDDDDGDGDTMNLLSPLQQRSNINHIRQASIQKSSSTLVLSNENPWKKLGHVRYNIDEHDIKDDNSSNYHHVYAQHITLV
ncbi:unnamed protein product [Rotaria sp. Silwood1]|nr:unnamed protein product [Rotaria sp. Silwood1]CAF1620005.1 unnamed protein product [Rotaria sp. Silwood1]CAF3784864.1 unnamed protein product [Rotaria sp. Silwood1]CAF3789765.1 unnamed protein product [Rotaria sp. Silwood1]CAF4807592.1 unnamed protein product [Rotaria sp. Silwood1]